jgi:hypothetical protein
MNFFAAAEKQADQSGVNKNVNIQGLEQRP